MGYSYDVKLLMEILIRPATADRSLRDREGSRCAGTICTGVHRYHDSKNWLAVRALQRHPFEQFLKIAEARTGSATKGGGGESLEGWPRHRHQRLFDKPGFRILER